MVDRAEVTVLDQFSHLSAEDQVTNDFRRAIVSRVAEVATPASMGPARRRVRFSVMEADFDALSAELIRLEKLGGNSTIQMFQEHARGKQEDSDFSRRWRSIFLLYLGTAEVKKVVSVQ